MVDTRNAEVKKEILMDVDYVRYLLDIINNDGVGSIDADTYYELMYLDIRLGEIVEELNGDKLGEVIRDIRSGVDGIIRNINVEELLGKDGNKVGKRVKKLRERKYARKRGGFNGLVPTERSYVMVGKIVSKIIRVVIDRLNKRREIKEARERQQLEEIAKGERSKSNLVQVYLKKRAVWVLSLLSVAVFIASGKLTVVVNNIASIGVVDTVISGLLVLLCVGIIGTVVFYQVVDVLFLVFDVREDDYDKIANKMNIHIEKGMEMFKYRKTLTKSIEARNMYLLERLLSMGDGEDKELIRLREVIEGRGMDAEYYRSLAVVEHIYDSRMRER